MPRLFLGLVGLLAMACPHCAAYNNGVSLTPPMGWVGELIPIEFAVITV